MLDLNRCPNILFFTGFFVHHFLFSPNPVSMTRTFTLLFLSLSFHLSLHAQLISFEKKASFSAEAIQQLLDAAGIPSFLLTAEYGVDYYKVVYQTPYLSPDSLVQVSGAVVVPQGVPCAMPLAGYAHGTQTHRDSVPSNLLGGEWEASVFFATSGVVVSLTDYIGLGEADDKVRLHPYLHAESQASSVIGALRASRELVDSLEVNLNEQVFLYGYSQGGFATAATAREIEQNFADEFMLTAMVPMSAPLDFNDLLFNSLFLNQESESPSLLPYILFAYQEVYQNLFEDPSEYFVSPYDTTLLPLFLAGDKSTAELDSFCTPIPRDMLKDSVLNAILTDSLHPLRINLMENDMLEGWAPRTPTFLAYCSGDSLVPAANSLRAIEQWTAQGATSIQSQDWGNLSHFFCASPAFLSARSFIGQFRGECVTHTLPGLDLTFRLYPNPTAGAITLAWEGELAAPLEWEIYDHMGRLLRKSEAALNAADHQLSFNLSPHASGLYRLIVRVNGRVQSYPFVLSR